MAQYLLLARHGSIGNAPIKRYYGSTDLPLDAAGKRQARALAELLRARRPARCFSSPLRRTLETAQTVATHLSLKVEVMPELREIDFGQWEGLSFEEIRQSDPDAVARWAAMWERSAKEARRDSPDFEFPGGERIHDFLERTSRAAELLAAVPGEEVVAFTHGGVIRAVICHLLGLPPRHYLAFKVKPASVTVIKLFDGKGVLVELNNQCCLEEL